MKAWKKRITAITLFLVLVVTAVFIKLYFSGKFASVETLREYIKSFGIFAPFTLIAFQALQVVVPVLPGFLGCAVGAVLFGAAGGFLCNYIGICTGSVIAYFLARRFGIDLVLTIFPKRMYEKWRVRIAQCRSYGVFLFVATLLPLFPDDFLCYFSGLMQMDRKRFLWIILLGKPWCILAYSIVFSLL